MGDIETRADIDAVLRAFYTQVFDDNLLRHVFIEIAHMDLEEHLPVIGNFWEKVLFNTSEYSGNAMRVHRHLHDREPLTPAHFERWLTVWNQTIDAHHQGAAAAQAKHHAARIALAMQRNLYRDAPSSTSPLPTLTRRRAKPTSGVRSSPTRPPAPESRDS